MAIRIFLKSPNGSGVVPTANGAIETEDMTSITASRTQVYIEFFSDEAGTQRVTPTAGTITIEGSPLGGIFLAPACGGVIDATTVSSPTATYDVPFFEGRIIRGKASFSGVTGAAFARVMFWRYD